MTYTIFRFDEDLIMDILKLVDTPYGWLKRASITTDGVKCDNDVAITLRQFVNAVNVDSVVGINVIGQGYYEENMEWTELHLHVVGVDGEHIYIIGEGYADFWLLSNIEKLLPEYRKIEIDCLLDWVVYTFGEHQDIVCNDELDLIKRELGLSE